MDRFENWVERRRGRVAGVNPLLLGVRVLRRFGEVRVTGLAAEMSYYALISLIPLTIALGASLGFLRGIIGPQQILMVEDSIVSGIATVLSPELTADVMEPLVRGLLHQERAGIALLGLLATFFFASAVFRAVISAFDDAYQVEERRSGMHLWGLAYALAMGSVLVVALLLTLVVVGPLLGAEIAIAEWFGLGDAFAVVWSVGRWLVVVAAASAYLGWLYRVAPNVKNSWRGSMPGAIGATVGVVLLSFGLQVYLGLAGPRAPQIAAAPEAVGVAAQTIGALLAVIFWIWLSSLVILTGGVFNAELRKARAARRRAMPPPDRPEPRVADAFPPA